MQLVFVIGNQIKYTARIPHTREQLGLKHKLISKTFKKPVKIIILTQKNKKDFESSSYSSDSFDQFGEDEEDNDDVDKIDEEDVVIEIGKVRNQFIQKHTRGNKSNTELESFLIDNNSKKYKKELTEEEINMKHEQMLKRKTHTQRILEEEKRQTIEKILNV